MRTTTIALLLTTALLGGATTAAVAQDAAKPSATTAESAEDAFLKAYFQEKELKAIDVAEKMYAAIVEQNPADREVLARSLLGRARCLRSQKRTADADALFARVEKDFAEFKDAATEAHDARRAAESQAGNDLAGRIRYDLEYPTWRDEAWKYGERGVPTFTALLRDESPETVYRAAETLARMNVPAAHEALAAAIEAKSSTYPEQVRNAAESDYACAGALRRLADSKDAEVRSSALSKLVFHGADAAAIEKVAADPALLARYLKWNEARESYGRLLVAALAHGGDSRAAALARLRGDALSVDAIVAFLDPPAPVLADAEAVAALARHIEARSRVTSSPRKPSPALVASLLRQPATAKIGIRLTLSNNVTSDDPGAFVDAVARNGFTDGYGDAMLADALVAALGSRPQPEILKRLAAVWPENDKGNFAPERFRVFLDRLIVSGVTDETSLLAFQEGLDAKSWQFRKMFIEALQNARRRANSIGPWAVSAFLRELQAKTSLETHHAAAECLDEWQAAYGDACGLAGRTTEIVAALGSGGTDHLTTVLGRIGPSSIDALKAALPTHPRKAYVVRALVVLGDKSSADAIEGVVAEVAAIADEDGRKDALASAVTSLVEVRGDAALDALSAAMVAHDGRAAANVLEAVGNLPDGGVAFGDGPRFALCRLALEKAPRALSESSSVADHLPKDRRRELAVLAMNSADRDDRLWGVYQETKLLDVDAWDALLVAAQDPDDETRDAAREALRAIRAKESELAEFRAMGEERATRKRIEALLASPSADVRCAGVAAVAATGFAGMVNDLIRLAAEDGHVDVREAARNALLAMAKPAAPAPQPASEKK